MDTIVLPLPRMPHATFSPYTIDMEEYSLLAHLAALLRLRYVVEFGPGASTCAWHDGGVGHVLSYEEDALAAYGPEVAGLLPADSHCVLHLPPGHVPGGHTLPRVPDLVFVDGPTAVVNPQARGPALNWALSLGCHVLLHDVRRPGEQQLLAVAQEDVEMKGKRLAMVPLPSARGLVLLRLV